MGRGDGGREGDPEIPCLESVISNVLFLLPFSKKGTKKSEEVLGYIDLEKSPRRE